MRAKLALSTLCENPHQRTGLSTLFPEFIAAARRLFPGVTWLVFVGRDAAWELEDPGVEVCRSFSSNSRRFSRLWDDHLRVGPAARARGAAALLTIGFFPLRSAALPVVMSIFAVGRPSGSGPLRAAYRRWAVRAGLKRAALVITNSAWAATQIGRARAQVVISPEGIRHDRFGLVGPSGATAVEGSYLLWASNLYPYKRIELALAAYASLAPSLRRQYPLLIAGGDWNGGRGRAEAVARGLGIAGDVHFLGWVGDAELPALYRGARAHLLSTAHETFGRSVLEAMACGCPSILQDLPVLREVAAECALYADYLDGPAAAAAIGRVCHDDVTHAALRTAGIARARLFSFERLAQERVGAILQMLEAASP
jgi:glycosyltransferase involved in cell wall biosynthesis